MSIIAFAASGGSTQRYKSTASILVTLNDPAERFVSAGTQSAESPIVQAAYAETQIEVILSTSVLEDVSKRLPGAAYSDLLRDVSAVRIGETAVIEVTAEDDTISGAVETTKAVVETYQTRRQAQDVAAVDAAIAQLDTSLEILRSELAIVAARPSDDATRPVELAALQAQLTSLSTRQTELRVDRTLKQGGVVVLSPAHVSNSLSVGARTSNTVVAFVLASILSLALWLSISAGRRRSASSPRHRAGAQSALADPDLSARAPALRPDAQQPDISATAQTAAPTTIAAAVAPPPADVPLWVDLRRVDSEPDELVAEAKEIVGHGQPELVVPARQAETSEASKSATVQNQDDDVKVKEASRPARGGITRLGASRAAVPAAATDGAASKRKVVVVANHHDANDAYGNGNGNGNEADSAADGTAETAADGGADPALNQALIAGYRWT